MKNEKYESPEIEVVSIEPDEKIMIGVPLASLNVEPIPDIPEA